MRCRDKGKDKDLCVEKPDITDCKSCNNLTEDQLSQLATPSYQLKKENQEAKKMESTPSKDTSSASVDPATVSVLGAVNVQGDLQSLLAVNLLQRNLRRTSPPPQKLKLVNLRASQPQIVR